MWEAFISTSSERSADEMPGWWLQFTQTFSAALTDAGIGGGTVFLAIAQAKDWFAGAHWVVVFAGGFGALSMPILIWVRICATWQLAKYNEARRRLAEQGRDSTRGYDT